MTLLLRWFDEGALLAARTTASTQLRAWATDGMAIAVKVHERWGDAGWFDLVEDSVRSLRADVAAIDAELARRRLGSAEGVAT